MPSRTVKQPPEKPPRKPTDRFNKFISQFDAVEGDLPLTHITDAYAFRNIMNESRIEPQHCTIFDRSLIYMFYGRPSYRANQGALSSSISAYAPICFILEPVFDLAICGVFPFDTGAFHRKMLERAFHEKMLKEDFALTPDLRTPSKLIRLFFGDNEKYFTNQPLKHVEAPPLELEVGSYQALIADEGKNDPDERISSIEIQIQNAFSLEGMVSAVIVPDNFLADDAVIDFAKGLKAELLSYTYIGRLRPDNYVGSIYGVVKSYYIKRGFLP